MVLVHLHVAFRRGGQFDARGRGDHLVDVDFDENTQLSFDGLFEQEIFHYIDCVKNGTACIAPAEDGVVLMKILDGIYESARTEHEVVIDW